MNRRLTRLLSALALMMLAVFVFQAGLVAAEKAGLACCGEAAENASQHKDGDGHCCPHAHPSPFQASLPIAIGGPALSQQQSFPRRDARAPEEPFRAIDQPPKLS